MKWVYGFLVLVFLIFTIDLMLVHIAEWRKRVQRERAARKWGMAPGAFKPTKANSWWEA